MGKELTNKQFTRLGDKAFAKINKKPSKTSKKPKSKLQEVLFIKPPATKMNTRITPCPVPWQNYMLRKWPWKQLWKQFKSTVVTGL